MRKKFFPFYDVLLYAIICGPLIVLALNLLLLMLSYGSSEWIHENWHVAIAFGVVFAIPLTGVLFVRKCTIENDSVQFVLRFAFLAATWKKFNLNMHSIDERWNKSLFISEVKDVQIVRLTEEEKREKVYYKHWFNKYLKIDLKYGKAKYVYVGNYANFQIRAIIILLKNG